MNHLNKIPFLKKQLKIAGMVLTLLLTFTAVYAQQDTQKPSVQKNPGQELAALFAQKMKDTLLLNEKQQSQLYTINMQINLRKQNARKEYAAAPEKAGKALQQIEGGRDSLYLAVLGEKKFALYKQKKRNLITNTTAERVVK